MTRFAIITLAFHLASGGPSIARDCTVLTPPQIPDTPVPLPYPASTLQQGQQVVVEVEVEFLLPPPQHDWWSLSFDFYHSDDLLGWTTFHTDPGREEVDQMWVRCAGERRSVKVHAPWSTPTNIMPRPINVIIQVKATRVTVLEVVEGKTWLVTDHTCDVPYPAFPNITVKVVCYHGERSNCSQLRQCWRAPTTDAAGDSQAEVYPTCTSQTVLWVLVVVEVVAVAGSMVAVAYCRRKHMQSGHFTIMAHQPQFMENDDNV